MVLSDQGPVNYVAATGPTIGQSVFPGETLARSLALPGQSISKAFARSLALSDQGPVNYVAAIGPTIGESVFPGEARAHSMAVTGQD